MNRVARTLLVTALLAFVAAASAESTPPRGKVDARVRAVAYDEAQVYRLRGIVGYQIDLQFEPGELFTGLGAGDVEALSFVGQENHLFLKPKAARVATNLTILTNRRHYQIAYTATQQRVVPEADAIYAVRFLYPILPEADTARADAQRVDAELQRSAGGRGMNFDYWYCGDPNLRPIAASDDGVHTRLTFAANGELPAVFVRNDDRTESLLNFSMDAGDLVIHRVARRYVLRRGKLAGCVVNQGYRGSGVRLDSGTVAPGVERRVQGAVP